MRKKKLATYAVALALAAAAMTGVTTQTAHAEEAVQVVATDTDAACTQETEAAVEPQTAEETTEAADVEADEVTVADGGNSYYNITTDGGTWNGNQYVLNGQTMINTFFCDGTYTYYLQADGTPMRDRLTYHPDGEHVIYFDADGHEVFSDFANVKKSIAGDPVDDMCFFDVYGYMYVNRLTYDQSGQNLYYINEYGVVERGNRWFQFPYGLMDIDGYYIFNNLCETYGFATENGALLTNTMSYNWNGKQVYLQGNGMTAMGLTELGGTWYLFNLNDGHLEQSYTTKPETYTYTYDLDGYTYVEVFNKNDDLLTYDKYSADGTQINHDENTYDAAGNRTTYSYYRIDPDDGSTESGSATYNAKGATISEVRNSSIYSETYGQMNIRREMNALEYPSGNIFYEKSVEYHNDQLYSIREAYYDDSSYVMGIGHGNITADKYSYYKDGVLNETKEYFNDAAGNKGYITKYYDAAGNVTKTVVYYY